MNKRKIIRSYFIVAIVVALCFLTAHILSPLFIKSITYRILMLGFVISFAFITIVVSTMFTRLYSVDWFKTQNELESELQAARNEWKRANDFVFIIGKHEAMKMWEEGKKKTTEAEISN